jgi:peptidase M28-like protein
MLNGRLYRAACVPFLAALVLAAFSLGSRPQPLASTLVPDAFEGQPAFAELARLASAFPDRRPGSVGDHKLADYVAATLKGLGGTAGGGFSVHTESFEGQTIEGRQALETVIAQRPGSTDATPIVLLAHRDAAKRGSSAELSGTVALLELARVFAARETKRTIVLVSSSGGSGGAAGAAAFLAATRGPFDGAIVLGDLAGTAAHRPFVVPYSDGFGAAPLQLQRTLADAVVHEAGVQPGAPSAIGQLAHLAFPLAVGEQGVLDEAGIPAVLVAPSGEAGPPIRAAVSAQEPVSAERLQGFGRAVLSTVDALDSAPDVSHTMQTGVLLQRKTVPAWALRALVGTLLLAPLLVAADGLARVRRRRRPVARWTLWTLSCALPFLACALLAYLLGLLGVLAAPAIPVPPGALPLDAAALTAVLAVALTFALAWLLWGMFVRRMHWGARPDPDVAGLAMLLVLLAISALVWVVNPYAALLALPALHLWLLVVSPELRPSRPWSLGLVALGLAPLALLIAFYAHQLGLGPAAVAWTALLLLAGGHIGLLGALLWSLALGCASAAVMLAARAPAPLAGPGGSDGVEITVRGPMSYAGPGSLGGTESALRR